MGQDVNQSACTTKRKSLFIPNLKLIYRLVQDVNVSKTDRSFY